MRRVGAEGFAFETIVASGTRSSLPHGLASDKRIGDDPLLVDFGLRRSGYCTDLTRMSAHQPEVLEIMKVVRDARQAAFQCIRPGIASTDIDGAARQAIVRAGYGEFFGHSLGHGLGLEVHELPRIGPTRGTPLEAGMVFTLEPGIYLPGRFGVRIEDVVVVEEAGARWLSDPEK
jgi:Xaa-Pro aminopeptidase